MLRAFIPLGFVLLGTPRVHAQCSTVVIEPEQPVTNTGFGRAVGQDGARVIVGATMGDEPTGNAGNAYIFEERAGAWVELALLFASDGANGDRFGESVAIHGERAVVGASGDDDFGLSAGAVYVFREVGAQWIEEAKLVSPQAAAGGLFGWKVALDGKQILVAERDAAIHGFASGVVWVFELHGGLWTPVQRIAEPDDEPGIRFGFALALDGERCAIASPDSEVAGEPIAGRVRVYERGARGWEQAALVTAPVPTIHANFGHSLALRDRRLLVGAPEDSGDTPKRDGAAHLFELHGDAWLPTAVLLASDTRPEYDFGIAVAWAGEVALVGSTLAETPPASENAVYLFRESDAGWTQIGRLVQPYIGFGVGQSLAGIGERALVGETARVRVFTLDPGLAADCSCTSSLAPCSNPDPVGGCATSRGFGARLQACGGSSASADDLLLDARWMLSGQPAILFAASDVAAAPEPFADGALCGAGTFKRFASITPSFPGHASFGPGLAALGGFTAGETWSFQAWFRDPTGPCGSGANLSNSIVVRYGP